MKTITIYTAKELKEKDPGAFERAHKNFIEEDSSEIPWSGEIMDSLKGIFKAAGIDLRNWSIGAYCNSYVRFDMGDAGELAGPRAAAWLENNLYSPLRVKPGLKGIADRIRYGYKVGTIPPCPFTGYCADDDMLGALNKAVASGDTLKEAFADLASVAQREMENESDYTQTEEYFLDMALGNEYEFTGDGTRI